SVTAAVWSRGSVAARFPLRAGRNSGHQRIFIPAWWRSHHGHHRCRGSARLDAGGPPFTLCRAVTADTLPDDSLLPPPVAGLMNGLPLAHELLAHVRDPALQPHSINLTQLPLSEADRLFLARLCGHGNIQIRISGYGESQINATALRHLWHVRCLDALKGPLLDSYEICPLPELVLAAPEDLADSRQRLDEVCRWLETR
ncbi:hydrogenase expression/formation protein, partial [Salmonella enterica]|uniref:hydrogenase expression/formation protein n=1 Tax=Salmonella enterica TaxID=28901 RepID=UPI002159F70C